MAGLVPHFERSIRASGARTLFIVACELAFSAALILSRKWLELGPLSEVLHLSGAVAFLVKAFHDWRHRGQIVASISCNGETVSLGLPEDIRVIPLKNLEKVVLGTAEGPAVIFVHDDHREDRWSSEHLDLTTRRDVKHHVEECRARVAATLRSVRREAP